MRLLSEHFPQHRAAAPSPQVCYTGKAALQALECLQRVPYTLPIIHRRRVCREAQECLQRRYHIITPARRTQKRRHCLLTLAKPPILRNKRVEVQTRSHVNMGSLPSSGLPASVGHNVRVLVKRKLLWCCGASV